MRSDRSNRYTAVPQAISDEDEGVYDESPESSQHVELLSMESLSAEANCSVGEDELQTLEFCRPSSHKPQLPLALVDVSTIKRHSKMSFSRKFCFFLSICVCVSYMVALLWLIPCSVAPCLLKTSRQISTLDLKEWNRTFPNLRLISEPQPVKVGSDGKAVLLLAFRLIDPNASVTSIGKSTDEPIGGVIALEGDNGNESWRHYFYTDVLGVICDVTDVDRDTISECVIVGSTGLLAAINASNGHIFWYLHDHDDQSIQINAISAPCPLPDMDLDKDGIEDLAVVGLLMYDGHKNRQSRRSTPEQYVNEQVFRLLLVSGGSGQIIGRPVFLPIAHIAHSSFRGYNRLPALLLYDLGNNSKSMLVLWGNGDGNLSDQHTNKGVIIMASVEQIYANAMKQLPIDEDDLADVAVDNVFKELYRGTGNLQSVMVMKNGDARAGDLVVLGSNSKELVFLDRSNGFLPKWVYKVENGIKMSLPVLGSFNKDHILDVFVIVQSVNHSSSADGCRSKAVIIDGKDGQEVTKLVTDCMLLKPFVVFGNHPNMSDLFLFETIEIVGDSFGNDLITERTPPPEVKKNGQAPVIHYSNNNSTAAVVLLDAYQTRQDKTDIWNDIHNIALGRNIKVPVSDNYSILSEIERMDLDDMHSATWIATSKSKVVSEEKSSTSQSTSILKLHSFQRDSEFPPGELNLHPVKSCCQFPCNPLLDTIIQENIIHPFLINIQENASATTITTLNLGTRIHSPNKGSAKHNKDALLHRMAD